ncbi:MAG: GntR family transcriptional regulator, partial [Victivallaceae bacterium]
MIPVAGKTTRNVVNSIIRRIEHGLCHPGENLGTEQELAAHFQVSRTTVRNAMAFLNEQKLVRRSAESGFEVADCVNESAKPGDRPKLLLIRAADMPLDNEIFSGVMTSPFAAHYEIIMVDGMGKYGNYAEILNTLPEDIYNILLFPLDIPEVIHAIDAAVKRNVRIVQLDRFIAEIEAPSVMFDNYAGASLAVQHLLTEHGLPVYYFGNYLSPSSAEKRFDGWRKMMIEFGFDTPETFLVGKVTREESDFTVAGYDVMLEHFLQEHPEPLSIFAVSDSFAQRIYKCCETLGRQIGRDVFVVGFDNLALCDRLVPGLS